MATPKLKGLGRGLDALLAANNDTDKAEGELQTLTAAELQPGKYQPRTRMDPGSLEELAASIKTQGVMQPILVRPVGSLFDAKRYEIIAGERRWRAAQIAGLSSVPCLVREIPDEAALAMSLIENIQREDLNPLEEAAGIAKYKARKKESQRKLISTDQNLVRLQDIIGELKRQIDSLQRQAQRAERYRNIKTQIEDLELWRGEKEKELLRKKMESLTFPCKLKVLRYVFRQAKPALRLGACLEDAMRRTGLDL